MKGIKGIIFRSRRLKSDSSKSTKNATVIDDLIINDEDSEDYWQRAINLFKTWRAYLDAKELFQKGANERTREQVWDSVEKDYNGMLSKVKQEEYRLWKEFGRSIERFNCFCKKYGVEPIGREFFTTRIREEDIPYYLDYCSSMWISFQEPISLARVDCKK